MKKMSDRVITDPVRLSADEARDLGRRALRSLGLAEEHAQTVVAHLVDAMLCGYPFAGLPRILAIADTPELQDPRTPVSISFETPVSAVVDGGNNPGYVAVHRGAEIAIEKARASGVAIVGVNNTWHSGRNAYYLEKIARAGFIGIHVASGGGMVVPSGATRPALGTNPLAIAVPSDPHPIIFDMGTGATMWGEVVLKAFLGEDFAEDVGLDAMGRPTRSAVEISKGGVLPFGGHKGYGLSFMIQALGLLAGSKRRHGEVFDFGYLFVVFTPDLLMPAGQFKQQLAELVTKIKAMQRQPGVDEIRIPSERSFRERELRTVEGVLLERRVYAALLAMGSA